MRTLQLQPLAGALSLLSVAAVSGAASSLLGGSPAQQGRHADLLLSPEQREILSHLSLVQLDDGRGGVVKTIRVSGVNLQIVNGLGATNGYPLDPESQDPVLTRTNGAGNLILGYNELGNGSGDDRTGSHNLVVGMQHSYEQFGGAAIGFRNTSGAPYACVSGGASNRALAIFASVTDGTNNDASGPDASVSGGFSNVASGSHASVTGGSQNTASETFATVSGGSSRQAAGSFNWTAGSLVESF